MKDKKKFIWKMGHTKFDFQEFDIYLTNKPAIVVNLKNDILEFEQKDLHELVLRLAEIIHDKYMDYVDIRSEIKFRDNVRRAFFGLGILKNKYEVKEGDKNKPK